MANLLFLAHRLPYPPNKGDKVRSYHLLKHLAARHRVFVGTFVDDSDDEQHVKTVQSLCAGMHVSRLHPKQARLRSLTGLLRNEPLTLGYYHDASLHAWVGDMRRRAGIDYVVVFSSSMAQYAREFAVPLLIDFVDVDSIKWGDYASAHAWPLSWLYRREGKRLLAYERSVAAGAARSFFVTEKERDLFRSVAPECGGAIEALGNGVDADYFSPDPDRPSPFSTDEVPVVFTGAMDYWPNVDAVTWFVKEMLPRLKERFPTLRFHIVGRNPTPAVHVLASETVNITGTVPDVRPHLQHARVVVAPLRLARGLQNKLLEAMAMARPVVAATDCVEAINAVSGTHLFRAETADGYVDEITRLLHAPTLAHAIGVAARDRVLSVYTWDSQLAGIDRHLGAARVQGPLS